VTIAALLVTALATGYAAAVVLRSKLRPWAAVPALLCYLLAGVQLALLFTLGGGVLLPGRQLNPAIVAEWQQVLSGTPLLSPWFTLVTLLAHLLVLISLPDRTGLLRPLPATVVFLALMLVARQSMARGPSQVVTGIGPDRVACLSIIPIGDGSVRMLLAEGAATDPLFDIRYDHAVTGPPPKPQVVWTKDGQVIVFRSRARALLALGVDGAVIGSLPSVKEDWPQENPNHESLSARRKFSRARMEVDRFVGEHGGFHIPPE
jgi:hypothetical protein